MTTSLNVLSLGHLHVWESFLVSDLSSSCDHFSEFRRWSLVRALPVDDYLNFAWPKCKILNAQAHENVCYTLSRYLMVKTVITLESWTHHSQGTFKCSIIFTFTVASSFPAEEKIWMMGLLIVDPCTRTNCLSSRIRAASFWNTLLLHYLHSLRWRFFTKWLPWQKFYTGSQQDPQRPYIHIHTWDPDKIVFEILRVYCTIAT